MKLGASYNLFDGEELLEYSILSIRENVDFISVVYQTESNFGNPGNEHVTDLLLKLEKEGLIDKVVHYTPVTDKHPHYNELAKRNIGLSLSKEADCTHHMSIDADELYEKGQFSDARNWIEYDSVESSVCRLTTYYKNNHTILDPLEDYYVSFIFKIRPNTFFNIIPFPVLVDPTRRMEAGNFVKFKTDELMMHHFSYVRQNLRMKLENSSAQENWDEAMMKKVIYHYSQWQPGMDALLAPATIHGTKQIEPIFKLNV